jgi:hypothetical protein
MTTARRAPDWGAEEISTAPHFFSATQQRRLRGSSLAVLPAGPARGECALGNGAETYATICLDHLTMAPNNSGTAAPGKDQPFLPFAETELLGVRLRPAEFALCISVTTQSVSSWIANGQVTLSADGLLNPAAAMRQLLCTGDPTRGLRADRHRRLTAVCPRNADDLNGIGALAAATFTDGETISASVPPQEGTAGRFSEKGRKLWATSSSYT